MMNIYAGNLDWQTTEAELREAFEAHGAVSSVSIIRDKQTGHSRGFGFIEMSSATEAQAAIDALNGTELNGRALTINQARERESRPNGNQQRNFKRGARSESRRNRRR
jgi:RNA recognition motif-containing protein